MFRIRVDRDSGVPLYVQIKDQITYEISVSSLPAGTILPSIRGLADQVGVATATIRQAYAALIDEGFVVAHQGRGMLVAELEHRVTATVDPQRGAIVALFTAAIGRALSLGARLEEIRSAADVALRVWADRPHVLFVVTEPEFIDRYLPILQDELSDLEVDVRPMLLSALLNGSLPTVVPLCVVTLVRGYETIRRAVADLGVPVTGLTLALSNETKAAMLDLPRGGSGFLVAERMNLAGMGALLEQYLPPGFELRPVPLELGDLSRATAGATVVVHTLRARQAIARLGLTGAQSVELRFLPDPVAVERLRRTIAASVQGRIRGSDARTLPAPA